MRKANAAALLLLLAASGFSSKARADEPAPTPAPEAAPAPAPAPVPAPAPEAAPAPAPEPAPSLGEPPPMKGAPRIHIEADRPGVRLLRIEKAISDDAGEGLLVRTACEAPCDRVVDGRRKQTFFFAAEGMVPSRGFQLSKLNGEITARISGGSFVARQLGFLFGGFGGVGLLGGVVLLGFGYGSNGGSLSEGGAVQPGDNSGLQQAGWISLGVGAALTTTALVLVLANKTKITLLQGDTKSAGIAISGGGLVF